MIFFDLNLLSPEKKKRLNHTVKFILSKDILELIILFCSVLAIALIWNWYVLQQHFTELASIVTTINRESSAQNQEIRDVNKIIKNLNFSTQGYTVFSAKITELVATLPTDVKLSAMSVDRVSQYASFSGTAKTRTALLAVQNSLSNVSWLEKVEAPVSQLFQKENINFDFKVKLKGFSALRSVAASARVKSQQGDLD